MLPVAVSLAVLATLGLATPIQQKPRAAVISLPARSTPLKVNKVFNREAADRERLRVSQKITNWKSAPQNGSAGPAPVKRSGVKALDINKLRRRQSGNEALTDDFNDGVDQRTCPSTFVIECY